MRTGVFDISKFNPRSNLGGMKHVIDQFNGGGGGNAFYAMTMDAAVAGGMAFLQSELEKRDPKVREPLTSVTWMRDIAIKSGGGWVDFTSVFNVDYGTSGPNALGILGGETNAIPTMQANIGKDIYPAFNWGNVMKVPYIDMQKLQGIGRSLDDLLDKGIRLNWNKVLDLITYFGPTSSYAGLVNSASITSGAAVAGASGSTQWNKKTPAEILNDVNTIMVNTWAASQYDISGMANHILIPPAQYAYIASQIISIAGNVSILSYLLENNIGKTQGVDLQIYPSRWCIGTANGGPAGDSSIAGAGSGGTDRMVAYVNDEDRVYLDITVPIQRAMTMPDVKEAAYLTLFLGQIGVVKFLFLQPAAYMDGI